MAMYLFAGLIVMATIVFLAWSAVGDYIRENERRIENMKSEAQMYDVRNSDRRS